jgi:hypothetical protein
MNWDKAQNQGVVIPAPGLIFDPENAVAPDFAKGLSYPAVTTKKL